MNKARNLVKKLKKYVIAKVEEDSVQERSMTQRVEKPESEQQNKIDEDESSKVQKQDLNHVENTLNEDVNQGVDEGMLKQEQVHTGVHSERIKIPLINKARVDNA